MSQAFTFALYRVYGARAMLWKVGLNLHDCCQLGLFRVSAKRISWKTAPTNLDQCKCGHLKCKLAKKIQWTFSRTIQCGLFSFYSLFYGLCMCRVSSYYPNKCVGCTKHSFWNTPSKWYIYYYISGLQPTLTTLLFYTRNRYVIMLKKCGIKRICVYSFNLNYVCINSSWYSRKSFDTIGKCQKERK